MSIMITMLIKTTNTKIATRLMWLLTKSETSFSPQQRIFTDQHRRKTNLPMGWINYRKAYDIFSPFWIKPFLNK